MNIKTVKDILKLNRDFYQSVSKEFSITRQKPWIGWNRAVESAVETLQLGKEVIKVLDIGCGNGRFYDFISRKVENIKYTGVDINNDFINEAKGKYNKASFIKQDIFKNLEKIKGNYNFVCAFGVTHHISGDSFRSQWFSKLPNLLDKKGVLILTFWNFKDKPGDYFLGWKSRKDVQRYCHQYSEKEITEIIETYKGKSLKLIDRYTSDKENLYLIFGTI
jgi:tRNA (uracil-5-)-methyltransferase TRM9